MVLIKLCPGVFSFSLVYLLQNFMRTVLYVVHFLSSCLGVGLLFGMECVYAHVHVCVCARARMCVHTCVVFSIMNWAAIGSHQTQYIFIWLSLPLHHGIGLSRHSPPSLNISSHKTPETHDYGFPPCLTTIVMMAVFCKSFLTVQPGYKDSLYQVFMMPKGGEKGKGVQIPQGVSSLSLSLSSEAQPTTAPS